MDRDEKETGDVSKEGSSRSITTTPVRSVFRSPLTVREKEAGRFNPENNIETPAGIYPSPLPSYLQPLKSDNAPCAPDENLPSDRFQELWKKPLKVNVSPVESPPEPLSSSPNRKKFQKTPTRHNSVLPPLRLQFDDTDESEQARKAHHAMRRSYSVPETGVVPKRTKLNTEDASPYEDFLKNKPTLNQRNDQRRLATASSTTCLTPAIKKLFTNKAPSDPVLLSVKTAVEKKELDPQLIGDASTTHLLPTIPNGKHADLKEISCATLANLIESKEDFPHVEYKVIDCRYPYEYDGGHINGALNLYMKSHIDAKLIQPKVTLDLTEDSSPSSAEIRTILIFHCEFSSKRGPKLCRLLRQLDRNANLIKYPALFYPELYVLHGGYKDFFEQFPHLCEPQSYVCMEDDRHTQQFKVYKSLTRL